MSGEQGLSLIEVLIAGAILILVLLGVATLSLTAQDHLGLSGENTAATTLGQQRVEWLRNQPYTASDLAAGTIIENLTGTFAGYTRTSTIVDATPRAGVKQISVTTTTPAGVRVEIVSLIAE